MLCLKVIITLLWRMMSMKAENLLKYKCYGIEIIIYLKPGIYCASDT